MKNASVRLKVLVLVVPAVLLLAAGTEAVRRYRERQRLLALQGILRTLVVELRPSGLGMNQGPPLPAATIIRRVLQGDALRRARNPYGGDVLFVVGGHPGGLGQIGLVGDDHYAYPGVENMEGPVVILFASYRSGGTTSLYVRVVPVG